MAALAFASWYLRSAAAAGSDRYQPIWTVWPRVGARDQLASLSCRGESYMHVARELCQRGSACRSRWVSEGFGGGAY